MEPLDPVVAGITISPLHEGQERLPGFGSALPDPEVNTLYFKNDTSSSTDSSGCIGDRLKTDVIATLESMDLVDPRRLTLNRSISCGERLTVEEVRADLESMEWHRCRVSSPSRPLSSDLVILPLLPYVVPVTREKENVDPTEDVGHSTPGGKGGLRVAKRRRGRPSSANKQMKVSDHLDHCDFPSLTFRQ